MKPSNPRWSRARGSAMLAALALALITAMMVGAGLYVAMGSRSQTWTEARSESALLLAEGGINDEVALIGGSVGNPVSSLPTVAVGTTMTYPGESHLVYGRQGSISGASDEQFWVCTSLNEWWRSGAAPVAWDGVANSFWITCTAYVRKSWRRAEVRMSKRSIFSQYAIYATDSNGIGDNIVDVAATASATITGNMATNGKVNLNGGSGLSLGNALNSNTALCASAQFTSSMVRAGSTLSTMAAPTVFARTPDVMKKLYGIFALSDIGAWAYLGLNNSNGTGIYTYKALASSATLAPANCQRTALPSNTLENYNILNILLPTKVCWDPCNVKPGTAGKVKTLIFEPGDYMLNDINLNYDASTELVIDPMALASGGTPGPVRFWVYDVPLLGGTDHIDIPIQMTKASGASAPDPSLFRVYYAKDGYGLTLNRPLNVKDYNGVNLTGDFNVYGCFYSVTKPVNDTSLFGGLVVYGTKIALAGTAGATGGKSIVNGSIIADHIGFKGPCAVNFVTSTSATDPGGGALVFGSYTDGK